jgi:hypothetical protein
MHNSVMRRLFGTAVAAFFFGSPPVLSVEGADQIAVPRWSVAEIALAATGTYENLYTQTSVTAAFTGPGGAKHTVRGFWDGERRFVIRFTPSIEGTWTYSTNSQDDGLNGKSGTIVCGPPAKNSHGFLRRDAEHPYSFVWDDGTRYFMWGQTAYDVLRVAMVNDGWKADVDKALAHGMTKIRFHVFAQGDKSSGYGGEPPQPEVHPFLGTGRKVDHDRPNLPYWRKLDEYVNYLASKRMVADLILFNPYGPASAHGTVAQDERFARYLLARYAAFPNVIWCLSNECEKSRDYWDGIGTIVRGEDPWASSGKFLRPLSIHQHTRKDFAFHDSNWPVHAIIQWGIGSRTDKGDVWGNEGITANLGHNRPVVNDEYCYIGNRSRTVVRGAIWGIAVAGGYGSSGDGRRFNDVEPQITGEWHDAEEYRDIRRMVEFFTQPGLEYWKMASQNALATAGTRVYVLAEKGRQYVIYAAVGGTFAIDVAAGTYSTRRFDPRTGDTTALPSFVGGGPCFFTMPDANDWVVVLKAEEQ